MWQDGIGGCKTLLLHLILKFILIAKRLLLRKNKKHNSHIEGSSMEFNSSNCTSKGMVNA